MRGIRLIIALIVIVALFHFLPFLNPAEAWVGRGFVGVGGLVRNAGQSLAGFPSALFNAGKAKTEIERLESRVQNLQEQTAGLLQAEEENKSLRLLLGFKERTDLVFIPANVVGTDPDYSVHALRINRGSEDGVRRGDAVIVGEGTYVGKIVQVSAGAATVLLGVDPRSAVAAMVQSRPEANGVAEGDRGLVLRLGLIPQNAEIREGDFVVTTGLEHGLPRGLLIGTVQSVTHTPSDPFASATILSAVDPLRLTAVAVVHTR